MRTCLLWTLPISAAALILAACGGAGGDKDSVCADFQYQEDAQAAYRAGAKQLDRDNDGIACEALPHRPPPATPGTPSGTYPSYNFFAGNGTLVRLRPAFGAYSLYYDDYSGSGGDTGPLTPIAAGGGLEVSTIGVSLRYFRTSDSTLLTWSPSQNGFTAATGVGVKTTAPGALATIAGTYKLLGQRCSPTTKVCGIAFGTASIASDGAFRICVGSEYSTTCPLIDVRALAPAVSLADDTATNVWAFGASGENLIASTTRGTVAFSYRDSRRDASGKQYSTDDFTFFGQLDGVTGTAGNIAIPMVSFDRAGQLQAAVPVESQWTVTAGRPLAGFFQDIAGNAYLYSTSGQLITWTVGSGLRHYSQP